MVNICGKCKYFMRSETDEKGNFHHYCDKANELYGIEPTLDSEAEPTAENEIIEPTLKVKFNDPICELYEKK